MIKLLAIALSLYAVQGATTVTPKTTDIVEDTPVTCVEDLWPIAKAKLTSMAYDYYAGAADDMYTFNDNREAFKRYRFRPRFMRNVSDIDLTTTILGIPVNSPFAISPTARQGMASKRGELDTAESAAKKGLIMGLSSLSTTSLEDVAKEFKKHATDGKGSIWMQLYLYKEHSLIEYIVRRAEAAGYTAFAVTIDSSYRGYRRGEAREKFVLPADLSLANFDGILPNGQNGSTWILNNLDTFFNPYNTWSKLTWLKSITKLKVIAKGILTPEDADAAINAGVDAVWVSSHGGRQLDSSPATIDAIDEILEVVGGRVEVFIDSGFRTGGDIAKALAKGVNAVFLGRANVFGLAYNGTEGSQKVMSMLQNELKTTMGLLGASNVKELVPSMIAPAFFAEHC